MTFSDCVHLSVGFKMRSVAGNGKQNVLESDSHPASALVVDCSRVDLLVTQ